VRPDKILREVAIDPSRRNPLGLYEPGEPEEMLGFQEGRPATRDEVVATIDARLPDLRRLAEPEGPQAVPAFERTLAGMKG
jgi:hypothetical protein